MKVKYLFMSMVAAFALAACSSENDAPVNEPAITDGAHYAYVNFAGKAVRAETESAVVTDVDVKNALFLFFKDGVQVADPYFIKEGMKDLDGKPMTDIKKGGLIVLSNMVVKPTQLFVVLNYMTNDIISEFKSLNEKQLIAKMSDLRANTEYNVEGVNPFIMTNEALIKGGVVKYGVACESNIKSTPDEARNNVVTVKVDRVLAGVNVKPETSMTYEFSKEKKFIDGEGNEITLEGDQIVLDGEVVKVSVEYPGYWIDQLATDNGYLFKNADGSWTAGNPFTGAVGTDGKVNWAKSAAAVFLRRPWKDDTSGRLGEKGAKFQLGDKKYYMLENTSATNKPTLIVCAKFKPKNAETTFYRFMGRYFTYDKLRDFFMQDINFKTLYKEDGKTQFTANDFDWEEFTVSKRSTLNPWEAEFDVKAKDGVEYYKYNGSELKKQSPEEVKAILDKVTTKCKKWLKGQAYFHLPFIHDGHFANPEAAEEADKAEKIVAQGIVRNHMYTISFNKILGLGIPVADEDGTIDPGTNPEEETDFHLAAKIEINEWVMKNHSGVILK